MNDDRLDLDAYLSRIGVSGPLGTDLETLRRLHLAHHTSIVFENLDIHLGRLIRLDIASLQEKLVRARRGGYCFEQNSLFAAALESIGFDVVRLGARVGPGDPRALKRTHLTLQVDVGGEQYLCDVGFGAGALFEPMRLRAGETVDQYGRGLRLVSTDYGLTLQLREDTEWIDQYQFTLDEIFHVDLVVANHYTSTHPDSGFVRVLTVQRESVDGQRILRGRTLTQTSPDGTTTRMIGSDEELLDVLSSEFGLSFPTGTVFRSPAET